MITIHNDGHGEYAMIHNTSPESDDVQRHRLLTSVRIHHTKRRKGRKKATKMVQYRQDGQLVTIGHARTTGRLNRTLARFEEQHPAMSARFESTLS